MMLGPVLVVVAHLAGLAEEDRVHLFVLRDEAGESCPDDEELADRVRARIGSEAFTHLGGGRELRVGIAKKRDGLEARVALFSKKGERLGRRVLSGDANCVRLADDLVLAVAIAIDPLLLVRRRPATAPGPEPLWPEEPTAPEEPAATPPAAPIPAAPPDAPEGYVEQRVVRRALPSIDLPAPASVVGRGLLLVSAGVGVVASPSVRGEVSLDYGVLDVDVGARFDLPSRYPIAATDGEALIDVTLLAAQAAPCIGWTWDITTVRGCGLGEAGALVAQGVGLRTARSVTTPWLALGARAAVDLRFWPTLGLVLTGDLVAPLVRPRFIDDVTGELYAQPGPVVGALGVGLELQIR